MKKIIYCLLMLPLLALCASCDDDDNKVPDVGIQATFSGATIEDGIIYVVQGEELKVDQLTLVNNSGKDGGMGVVTYYINGALIGQSYTRPYEFEIPTNLTPGDYLLEISTPIYVVDYPICYGFFSYKMRVVETAEDLPSQPETQTVSGLIKDKN